MAWVRGEIVGPARAVLKPDTATFVDGVFSDCIADRSGKLVWFPENRKEPEEVLFFGGEMPHRKYGAGLLYPETGARTLTGSDTLPSELALEVNDTVGVEIEPEPGEDADSSVQADAGDSEDGQGDESDANTDREDFDVASADLRYPSTLGISLCVQLNEDGKIIVRLPQFRRFPWQEEDSPPFELNGCYEQCTRRWTADDKTRESTMWRRYPAVPPDCRVVIHRNELKSGEPISRSVPSSSPLALELEVFPRYRKKEKLWLLTVVLRNRTATSSKEAINRSILYQAYFEVSAEDGRMQKYPESQIPFERLDEEERSLGLLYRESATWGIGHGCSAAWDSEPGACPEFIYADVIPAVQLPSMTPDITGRDGKPLHLSMRELSQLPAAGTGLAWRSLDGMHAEYSAWIERERQRVDSELSAHFLSIAREHLDRCEECLGRIAAGIALLRENPTVRQSFRLTNLAMLLQQISTKQLKRRSLFFDERHEQIKPEGPYLSPWDIYAEGGESDGLGTWRAFQMAFLLMSLEGVHNGKSRDRDLVDLIWFPTGGGKTEAYLSVVAFHMFHERLIMDGKKGDLPRDGVNVLMRYTLRMLTTQQFQRAASLVCAMEFLRRNPGLHGIAPEIPGKRFSLGLWIGGGGSPNNIKEAREEVNQYRLGNGAGNPLVLTECPWCRGQLGRFDRGAKTKKTPRGKRSASQTVGISDVDGEGPLLHCSDAACPFGRRNPGDWLPIEVIDERIYRNPPSLIIGTADKFAMMAYRPEAGSIFGRNECDLPELTAMPPGLIIQDELHLISGPLGTLYALYEGVFERLCSTTVDGVIIRPKIIASTATIRGAADQVKSLYARTETRLFPSPGLTMGDSFFGKYARDESGALLSGRMYMGLHAGNYASILTTQVRSFASLLFRPWAFNEDNRDPWWTLLAFYNSIRELGGARTLFDSDIRSRLKFIFKREGYKPGERRNLQSVEELTGRLSQTEIVGMMDRLSRPYTADDRRVIDACLASNIIEVGVDIDRLSLMAVVGQPKTTATYIQVTGRVGRKWSQRPGLILMVYNPGKSRDRSHFEQFHSYHRRLYERVEPTSATPFALSAIKRALPGALIAWARQQSAADVGVVTAYRDAVSVILEHLKERCRTIQASPDIERSLREMDRVHADLMRKWGNNPIEWERFPPVQEGEYLMLWPGQYATSRQKKHGIVVPSSMRQVDGTANLRIDQAYSVESGDTGGEGER